MKEAMKHFSSNPVNIEIQRSKQKMGSSLKTTYNTGHLIPIYWREVIPGSTCKMKMSEILRMQTPLFPIMDNAFYDTYFFFVPYRLLWEHWEEFMGENKTGYWEQPIDYEVPQIIFDSDDTLITYDPENPVPEDKPPAWIKGNKWYKKQVQAGSLADYMGIPISDGNLATPFARGEFEVSALPFRSYYQIYNDWFRDENLMLPIDFDKGDSDITAEIGSADPDETNCMIPPKYVAKFHDYFTSCLPQPQKHDDVIIPLGSTAPVIYSGEVAKNQSKDTNLVGLKALLYRNTGSDTQHYGFTDGTTAAVASTIGKHISLEADLTESTAVTINQLRQSFAIQRFYEKQARGGSRYIEQLKSMFGVTSPDARLQRAEYLGGFRKAINIDQVIQTSATDLITPQGNVAAYSLSTANEELFTKSFVEHGILMGVQVARLEHSYQDGIDRMFIRKNLFDFYNPTFANLGEMPVYNKEIFAGTQYDDEAFGYQEPWAEYRYRNNRVTGEMRSKYHQTLDAWHFADNYSALPSLSFTWLEEYEDQLNRNIAVSYQNADQWLADIYFEETWTQPMPTYSVPGLIDHY